MSTNELFARTLHSIKQAPPQRHRLLTVYPLFVADLAPARAYLTLEEDTLQRRLSITEVSQAGTVQELRVTNGAAQPVLLVDGEQLVGAKQNRVLNLSILVPAASTLIVPVSCVEQRRWKWTSREFVAAPTMQHASGRARKMAAVGQSMRTGGDCRGNQADVWNDVAMLSVDFGVKSATGQMDAVYRRMDNDLSALLADFTHLPGQVGAILTTRSETTGVELFDHPDTWRAMMPKVLRSYGLDALRRAHDEPKQMETPRAILEILSHGPWERYPGIGLGHALRVELGRSTGGALEWNERLIHVSCLSHS
jgi:hypothetical protein